MSFQVPNNQTIKEAIGLDVVPPDQLDWFNWDHDQKEKSQTSQLFQHVEKPGPSDWLACHKEAGQSFQKFLGSAYNKLTAARNKIYILPIGEFNPSLSPSLDSLRDYGLAFFQMDFVVLPYVPLEESDSSLSAVYQRNGRATRHQITHRLQKKWRRQLFVPDLLEFLHKNTPEDAYCIVGVTMDDLYPDPSWNFVFGCADLRRRMGVFSFARYHPDFETREKGPMNDTQSGLLLKRSCKVLSHETGHMFGIKHCIFCNCLMNGSNHLDESDSRAMFLCPVDLHKLHHIIGFDIRKRYSDLLIFCKTNRAFQDEAEWLRKRLALPQAE